jgi:hypothetical protein
VELNPIKELQPDGRSLLQAIPVVELNPIVEVQPEGRLISCDPSHFLPVVVLYP